MLTNIKDVLLTESNTHKHIERDIKIGYELIHNNFINDPVLDQLRGQFEHIINNPELSSIRVKEVLEEIDQIIYNRFGIPVKCYISNFTATTVVTDINHIFIDKTYRKLSKDFTYSVDINKARIIGLPKTRVADIYIGVDILYNNFTIDEVLFAFLHEVGHTFYTYYYIGRFVKNNSILLRAVAMAKKGKKAEAEKLIYTISKEDNSGKSPNTVIEEDLKAILTLGGMSNSHDFEALADTFPTRFGLAGAGARVLEKITKNYENQILIANFIIHIYLLTIERFLLGSFIYMLIFKIAISMFIILTTSIIGAKSKNPYETLKERLRSIKLESIRMIRVNNISRNDKAIIIDAIKDIDKVLNRIDISSLNHLYTIFMYIPVETNLKFNDDYLIQKSLEYLESNDLYYLVEDIKLINKGKK